MPRLSREKLGQIALEFQKNELTGHLIYKRLALSCAGKNRPILEKISRMELKHYNFWKKFTKTDAKPDSWELFHHLLLARIFGLTFALKLLESEEIQKQKKYIQALAFFPGAKKFFDHEENGELKLLRMIFEERLQYVGSMMLGIGDAVVEFTGTLSGLAFALQNTKLIGLAGMIGGIAASMSMASSEYLSKKSDNSFQSPRKAALYTGVAYFVVVSLLVLPNFIFENALLALAGTISAAVLVIVVFTYFVSVTREVSFKRHLAETLLVSFGIALISFIIGIALKSFLNITV